MFTSTVSDQGQTTIPPSVRKALKAPPGNLWPANHKLVLVTVNYSTSDNCGMASYSLSATSNEPDNGLGDGDQANDIQLIPGDPHHLYLRAERSGSGTGRVYTITITCADIYGNIATQNVTVAVPHDQDKK
jgi:hypothetical protein